MVSARRRLDVVHTAPFPAYVVWELTLRCDLACRHCGSRAGRARPDELSTDEALDVVRQLEGLGAREVVLIGGEAYLHDGFLDVVRALAAVDITPIMTTGGRGVTPALARDMAAAGMARVSVSIDGVEATHDLIRAARGSFAAAVAALEACADAGMVVQANTNFNRLNRDEVEALYEILRPHIRSWQVQLTTPLGRAADRTDMTLQPWDLLDLVPRIAAVKERAYAEQILVVPGNNLGYFGPEEAALRSTRPGARDHWQGCQAGKFVMGIESDGGVKGCPSLQAEYIGGSVRERSLKALWDDAPEIGFARTRTADELWGFCKTCAFADPCRGGCSFTAHALLGRRGNNPYCHYRALDFARRGLRERLVPGRAAPGQPFDYGLFEIVVEPLGAPDPSAQVPRGDLVRITRRPRVE